MINPESLNIESLPWLPLEARSAFPKQSAIYFAIDSQNNIQYIGRSVNPKNRWSGHHKFSDLQEIGNVRIAYLFVDTDLLENTEAALISWFKPPLNLVGINEPSEDKTTANLKGGMKNKLGELIQKLGVTPYRFAEQTGISKNTVYLLKNKPSQFPSGEVFDRIIARYNVTPNDIVEWYPEDKTT